VSSSLNWGVLCILVFETLAMELIKSTAQIWHSPCSHFFS
jgi:hypothetical protein